MLTIHADPITVNCRKVLAGLELMGVPYTLKHVDYFKGEQKSPEYMAINPNASIPAMSDGDYVL
jgi:glutathione S-transferase